MTRWIIHLTLRDELGNRTQQPFGSYLRSELPLAIPVAIERGSRDGGGIQVVREPSVPGVGGVLAGRGPVVGSIAVARRGTG